MDENYQVVLTKEARKDFEKLSPKLREKLKEVLCGELLTNPYGGKKLVGDLAGFFSLRLSYRDRIVYSIDELHHRVYVHRVKTHYGE